MVTNGTLLALNQNHIVLALFLGKHVFHHD
jgi:hypothetical protein